jgi:hypothetical protein
MLLVSGAGFKSVRQHTCTQRFSEALFPDVIGQFAEYNGELAAVARLGSSGGVAGDLANLTGGVKSEEVTGLERGFP